MADTSSSSSPDSSDEGSPASPQHVPCSSPLEDRFIELRSLVLNKREKIVGWWLNAVAILLTLFGFALIIGGYLAVNKIEHTYEKMNAMEQQAREHLSEIQKSESIADVSATRIKDTLRQSRSDAREIRHIKRSTRTLTK